MAKKQAEINPADFPEKIFRVILFANVESGLSVEVTEIPCQRKAQVVKTAHRKSISLTSLMKPSSLDGNLGEYLYCNDAGEVQKAVDLLVSRARSKAAAAIEAAEKLHKAVLAAPAISQEAWKPER